MSRIHRWTLTAVVLLGTTIAAADTRLVTISHTDGFTVMGTEQPARDGRQTIWFDETRLRVDQGDRSFVVLPAERRLLLLDHEARTWSQLDLPIDVESLLPEGMAEQVRSMMQIDATVVPGDATRVEDGRTLERWDLTLVSPMTTVTTALWVTDDVGFDPSAYHDLYAPILSLQPGMEAVAETLRTVPGYVVLQEGTMRMPMAGVEVATSERTESIEKVDPPDGHYAPPPAYEQVTFDLMNALGADAGR